VDPATKTKNNRSEKQERPFTNDNNSKNKATIVKSPLTKQ